MTKLRRLRLADERKPSQAVVAKAAGIDAACYSRVESGDLTAAGDTAKRLADYFGVALEVIFTPTRYAAEDADTDTTVRDVEGIACRHLIATAVDAAKQTVLGQPTDAARRSRRWIAVRRHEATERDSFAWACERLGLDEETERNRLLREIDNAALSAGEAADEVTVH